LGESVPDSDFDINELLEDLCQELKEEAKEHRVSLLGFTLPDLIRHYISDVDTIRAAIYTLTRSAIQASLGSEMCVLASRSPFTLDPPGQQTVRFAVTATIPRENWMSGVAEAEILLRGMDVSIQINEAPSQGSEASFAIPLRIDQSKSKQVRGSSELADLNIFIVSNEPPPNRAIHNYLRGVGANCVGAPTAEEAFIELTRGISGGHAYELILVATPIPDASHVEIAKALKESDCANVPLIHLDRYYREDEQLASLAGGFDAYISKPFREEDLLALVAKLTGRKVPDQDLPPPVVLVVEDNVINQKVLSFQLRRLGYDADFASNGREGLEALRKKRYCVVLMDLQMPVMDGFEAAAEIRKNPEYKDLAVVAVTANSDPATRKRCMEIGMTDFVAKPAGIEDIRKVVERFCPMRQISGKVSGQ
jgi:two-component system, sensor histidine kinase and response regulator